jgi:uncharacterized alpha/beta hydrolase family protein
MNLKRYNKLVENLHLLEIDLEKGTVKNGKNKIFCTKDGYQLISIRSEKYYIHQIIAVAGGLDILNLTVNHKDGDKSNNSIHNLEAMSMKQQMQHAFGTGLVDIEKVRKSAKSRWAK